MNDFIDFNGLEIWYQGQRSKLILFIYMYIYTYVLLLLVTIFKDMLCK